MTYTYPPEEYARQLEVYNELEKLSFSPEDSREYILSKLEERSAKKRLIADIANCCVREYIETFEKDPEAMTAEDAEKLSAFYNALHQRGVIVPENTDYAIMLRIQQSLKRYYERTGDVNEAVSALCLADFNYLSLFAIHSNSYGESVYAEEILKLKDIYEDLPPYQRMRVLTSFTRLNLVSDGCVSSGGFSLERCWSILDATRELTEKSRSLRAVEPPEAWEGIPEDFEDIVWQHAMLRVLEMFYRIGEYEKNRGRVLDLAAVRPHLQPILDELRSARENGQLKLSGKNLCMGHLAMFLSRYFLENMPWETFLKGLDAIRQEALSLKDQDSLAVLAVIDNVYMRYLWMFSGHGPEKIAQLCRSRLDEALPRVLRFARQINNAKFNNIPLDYVTAASYTSRFSDFASTVLDLTIYSDKALFIHTAMVREMSRAIFDWMIVHTPEAFDGVAGYDAEYIRTHKDDMRALLDDCCMYHDLGKFWMIDLTENSLRRLTDDEFKIIKEHPQRFEDVYAHLDEDDERFMCIHDCALTHHLWHDGTRGYPNVPQTKNRPFADILAVADSIDAATDFLGRPYNSGKTIDQLIEEFRAGAGTHYGPEACDALSVPEVRDKLEYLITEGRREIYYRIYAYNKL